MSSGARPHSTPVVTGCRVWLLGIMAEGVARTVMVQGAVVSYWCLTPLDSDTACAWGREEALGQIVDNKAFLGSATLLLSSAQVSFAACECILNS